MSDNLITREAAIKEMQGWARALGEVYTEDELETSKTLAAVMNGRVTFDESAESFAYKLIKPLDLDNGKTIDTITIEEPTAEYMLKRSTLKFDKTGTGELDLDVEARYLSASTHQPLGILMRLKARDINVVKELAHFFG